MNEVLTSETIKEIDHWLGKFPNDKQRSAIIGSLHAAQHQNHGFLTSELMDAVADYLASEGGAASEEGTEKIVSDKVDGVDAKSYLAKKERFKQLTVGDDPQDYYDATLTEVRRTIREKLEKIGLYKKYSYGLDDIPDKTKAHDDIIGHT